MKTRSLLILAALVVGLSYQTKAQAHTIEERNSDCPSQVTEVTTDGSVTPEQEVPEGDTPSETPGDEDGKVCFCHNVTHHPHTICTSDEGLINGHMKHVNGEVPGVVDTLGPCEVEASPSPTPEPTDAPDDVDQPWDDGDQGDQPGDVDQQPGDEGEQPGDAGQEPGNDTQDNNKVDGFEPVSAIQAGNTPTDAANNDQSGIFFEGSGCSLAGVAGNVDIAGWTMLAGTMMFSTIIRRRK